ncbi:MAG: hypothetical protein WBD55_02875 [Dehalococcoidia bacterium]
MVRRRIRRIITLTFDPLAGFDSVIRIPELLLTAVGVSLTTALLGGTVFVTRALKTGVWGTIAILAILLLLLVIRAAYQLVCEVEVKRDRAARAAEIGQLIDGFGEIWHDGDTIKWMIEDNWKSGNERDVAVYRLQVAELLEQTRPQFLAGFLNDGFPDGGIQPRPGWTSERNRAFRDITVRLHRLKEEVLDKLLAEQDAYKEIDAAE